MPSMQMKDMKNKPEDDIKMLAAGLGIPLSVEEEELESKGWVGQAKGLLQILWERGWIHDTKNPNKHYTISGRKDLFWKYHPGDFPAGLDGQSPRLPKRSDSFARKTWTAWSNCPLFTKMPRQIGRRGH